MSLKKLYIFVEGNDDERFFKSVIKPLFYKKYNDIEILQYRQWKKDKVDKFIFSINTLKFDYIFTADYDESESTNQRRKALLKIYSNVDEESVIIVITEIESWYLAGLSDNKAELFNLKPVENTDTVTKEFFNLLTHRKFGSRIDFMIELLKNYSVESAMEKNRSFKYFIKKYLDPKS